MPAQGSRLRAPDALDDLWGQIVGSEAESTPEVIAYRLGRIEEQLKGLAESSITPAVYKIHRDADADRFARIEANLAKEEELRGKQDESRRTMRLAIALAIVSPILSYLLANFGPAVGP